MFLDPIKDGDGKSTDPAADIAGFPAGLARLEADRRAAPVKMPKSRGKRFDDLVLDAPTGHASPSGSRRII